jgi:aryl-alcohol dehydrogenase-like predicted oxidoreductase
MEYHFLGNTGLKVSKLSFGTASLGMKYGLAGEMPPVTVEAIALLRNVQSLGINFYDTARNYGIAEYLLGLAFNSLEIKPIFATKLSRIPEYKGKPFDQVANSIAISQNYLQVNPLDLLQLHSATAGEINNKELIKALVRAKQSGYVRFLGATVYTVEEAELACASSWCDVLQVPYSILDQRFAPVIDSCVQKGIGVVARSVLAKGALGKYEFAQLTQLGVPGAVSARVAQLGDLAREAGISLPELAYRFVLGNVNVHTALIGGSNIEEVRACVGYAEKDALDADILERSRGIVSGVTDLDISKWG